MSRFILPFQSVFDKNGHPLDGAKLFFYETGTSTPKDTYSDQGFTTANANPVIADSQGEFGAIFLSGTYRAELKDKNDVTQPGYPTDSVPGETGDTVLNIAALKLIEGRSNQRIVLLGYTAAGDDGGGQFYWDATSTETDNSGTIIKATSVVTGRWKRLNIEFINVKWFGATGDGVTDDTTAIQAAIDYIISSEGTLRIPAGTYLISSDLNATGNNISLIGDGINATMILSSNVATHILKMGGANTVYRGFTLEYATDPVVTDTGAIPIILSGLRRSTVESINIGLCYSAISIEQATGFGQSSGKNAEWSNLFANITCFGWFGICVNLVSYGTGSSGSIWDNIVISNSGYTHTVISALALSAYNNFAGTQINIEWCSPTGNIVTIGGVSNSITFDNMHFEEVKPQTENLSFIAIASKSKLHLTSMVIRTTDFSDASISGYNLFGLGIDAQIEADGVYEISTTLDGGGTTFNVGKYIGASVSNASVRMRAVEVDDLVADIFIASALTSSNPAQFPILQQFNNINYDHKDVGRNYVTTGNYTPIHGSKGPLLFFNGANFTASYTVTLDTSGAIKGQVYKVVRDAVDTGGPWNLSVGGLKILLAGEWCEVYFDGSVWKLTAFGAL